MPAHRADLALLEPDCHTVASAENYVVLARCQINGNQIIVRVEMIAITPDALGLP